MPSASVIVRVTGGGGACIGAGDCTRGPWSRRAPGRWLPGRWCIGGRYAGMPGRGGTAGRTGCDGSGRGPPIGGSGTRRYAAARTRRRRTRLARPRVLRAAGRGRPAEISCRRLRCRRRRAAPADGRAPGAAAARAAPGRFVDLRPADAASAARCGRSRAAALSAARAGGGGAAWRRRCLGTREVPVGACDPAGFGRARLPSAPASRLADADARGCLSVPASRPGRRWPQPEGL